MLARPASRATAVLRSRRHLVAARRLSDAAVPLSMRSVQRDAARSVASALQSDAAFAGDLIESLGPEERKLLAVAAIRSEASTARAEFASADTNADGVLGVHEFEAWLEKSAKGAAAKVGVTKQQLHATALRTGIPMVGFGFLDNAIMLIAGDAIDHSFGVVLGISTLAAAGLGNLVSDLAGLGLGDYVERICARMGIGEANLTKYQEKLRVVGRWKLLGTVVGVTIGCLLGMLPLLFMDTNHRNKEQMFEMLDDAGDGVIHVPELRRGLKKLGIEVSNDGFHAMMRQHDKDEDGSLSFEEFSKLVDFASNGGVESLSTAAAAAATKAASASHTP